MNLFVVAALFTLPALGLSLLMGYTGQISLGHGAFMAIGGYTTAILMIDHGVKDIATIPFAIVVAGVAGVPGRTGSPFPELVRGTGRFG